MKARLTVMGSGTSMGVPTIGCDCAVCMSDDPYDKRTRPSVLLEYNGRTVLIDSTPDFRQQAIRENLRKLDAVVYTHGHADHILGLDDLRPLTFHRDDGPVPLYADASTGRVLQSVFRYIFDGNYKFGGLAKVELRMIDGPFHLFGARFEPIAVFHGDAEILGFRFGKAAYLTDFSKVPDAAFEALRGVEVLFLDALRHRPHPTHSTVSHSLSIAEKVAATQTFFTHICHDLPHRQTNASLPPNVQLAFDGMKLEFEIASE